MSKNAENTTILSWMNPHTVCENLGISVPHPIDLNGDITTVSKLAELLPRELALQELNAAPYARQLLITVPPELAEHYTYRPTPMFRAIELERALGLTNTRIYIKDETANDVGSYKPNAALAQAFYAKREGVTEIVADTVPANWGLALAKAGHIFGIKALIMIDKRNYAKQTEKIAEMRSYGAEVIEIDTPHGTIAESLSHAAEYVSKDPKNRKLALGCIATISSLENTLIGQEIVNDLAKEGVTPDVIAGVIGGGSSFLGAVIPMMNAYGDKVEYLAVESENAPALTKGEYRYGKQDVDARLPLVKMHTLGTGHESKNQFGGGVQLHGRNPVLSALVNAAKVKPIHVSREDAEWARRILAEREGIIAAPEPSYGLAGALKAAQRLDGEASDSEKVVVFTLTGKSASLPTRANTMAEKAASLAIAYKSIGITEDALALQISGIKFLTQETAEILGKFSLSDNNLLDVELTSKQIIFTYLYPKYERTRFEQELSHLDESAVAYYEEEANAQESYVEELLTLSGLANQSEKSFVRTAGTTSDVKVAVPMTPENLQNLLIAAETIQSKKLKWTNSVSDDSVRAAQIR